MKTRNISMNEELDRKTVNLLKELKLLGYERNYSSIIRECLMLSLDQIMEHYKEIAVKVKQTTKRGYIND